MCSEEDAKILHLFFVHIQIKAIGTNMSFVIVPKIRPRI
jgi:hypothetical protein